MGKETKKQLKQQGEGGKQPSSLVKDPRFSAIQTDPRFHKFPRVKNKIEVDERFSGMFKDPSFQMRATLDKRGRKLKSSKKNEDMRRYYRMKEEEDWMLKSRSEETMDRSREDSMARRKDSAREKIFIEKEIEVDAKGGHRSRKGSNNESSVSREKQTLDASKTVEEEQADESEREEEVIDSDDRDLDDEEDLARERWLRMRGLAGPDASSESDDDDDADIGDGSVVLADDSSSSSPSYSSDDDDEQQQQQQDGHGNEGNMDDDGSEDEDSELKAALEQWGVGAMAANPSEQVPLLPDATHRIAVVDLDWEHVRAVDIFATLRSFLPTGGRLEKVTVYPSDYGLERMAEEAISGPQNVWKKRRKERGSQNGVVKGNRHDDGDDDGDDGLSDTMEEEGSSSEEDDGPLLEDASSDEDSSEGEDDDDEEEEEDGGGEVDPVQLRLYERSKLRWYYAIAEFDSAATANAIYEECDGMEFLKSACKFDLRFVPDNASFTERRIRDVATDVDIDYEPPTFQTKALQHTNVEFTWDKGDDIRRKALTRRINDAELREDDFKAYLASSTDDDDDDDGDDGGEEEEEGHDAQEQEEMAGKEETVQQNGKIKKKKKEDSADALRERYRRLLMLDASAKERSDPATERKGTKDWSRGDRVEDDDTDHSDEDGDVGGSSDGDIVDDGNMEMQVTFDGDLESLAARLSEKQHAARAKKSETVWDAYMRRKREKKEELRRLGRSTAASDSDDISDDSETGYDRRSRASKGDGHATANQTQREDAGFDDPFFQTDPDGHRFDDSVGDDGPAVRDRHDTKSGKQRTGKKKTKGQKYVDTDGMGPDDDAEREQQKKQAQLEMLLLDENKLLQRARTMKDQVADDVAVGDDDDDDRAVLFSGEEKRGTHGSKKKISKKERMRLLKDRKRRERAEESADEEGDVDPFAKKRKKKKANISATLDDPRFVSLFTSSDFALDPTDPRFAKAGPGAETIAAEVARRKSGIVTDEMKSQRGGGGGGGGRDVSKVRHGGQDGGIIGDQRHASDEPKKMKSKGSGAAAADLKLMVASLKRKAKKTKQ